MIRYLDLGARGGPKKGCFWRLGLGFRDVWGVELV